MGTGILLTIITIFSLLAITAIISIRRSKRKKKIAEELQKNPKFHYSEAQQYIERKDYLNAISSFTKAMRLKESCVLSFERGNAYKEIGNNINAIQDYSKAIELSSSESLYWNSRAIVFYENGDIVSACRDWERASALGNGNAGEMLRKYDDIRFKIKNIQRKNYDKLKSNSGNFISKEQLIDTVWRVRYFGIVKKVNEIKFEKENLSISDSNSCNSWIVLGNAVLLVLDILNGYDNIDIYCGTIEENYFSGFANKQKNGPSWRFEAELISLSNNYMSPGLREIRNTYEHGFSLCVNLGKPSETKSFLEVPIEDKIIQKTGFSLDLKQFRDAITDDIYVNNKYREFKSYYVYDYFPKNRYGNDVDKEISDIRELVYDFKDGYNSSDVGNIISDCIQKEKINLRNSCFVIIPASTPEKTEDRFSYFCQIVCESIKVKNSFDAITSVPRAATKGTSEGNKIKHFTFNNSFYKNKNVILFDDIRTSGTSYIQVLTELMNTGARNVTGVFLAKTVS